MKTLKNYEAPEVEQMILRVEDGFLEGSVTATRNSYGDAIVEEWD